MLRRLHPEQPESFDFTPANLAWAEAQIAKYPEAPGLRGDPAAVARPGAGGVGLAARDRVHRPHARHGLYPGAGGRDLLLHVPAPARWKDGASPDLRDHLLHDLRGGGADRGLQVEDRGPCPSALRGRDAELGGGRMPRVLLERADGADRQGLLRGPDAGPARRDDRRLPRRRGAGPGAAERPLGLGAAGRPDQPDRDPAGREGQRLRGAGRGAERHDRPDHRRDAADRDLGAQRGAAGGDGGPGEDGCGDDRAGDGQRRVDRGGADRSGDV